MKVISVCLGVTCGILAGGMSLPAMAQVTSDGTTNTIVNQSGNNFNILNGVNKGNNLFHSFSNFSVPTGGAAKFDLTNTPNITTIFSRVTGGNVSNIDGVIRTLNSSNPVSLFLMNPNGIMFGPNAQLNIGGAFIGTTAQSIQFADGTQFSAANPTPPSLLTMSVPVGLQMGTQANAIRNQSQARDPISNQPVGLQVAPRQTLALLGGDLQFQSGMLAAPEGRIELGSVAPNSTVQLVATQPGWRFNYADGQQFQAIDLSKQSAISVVGNTGGDIQIQGRTIRMQDGSKILADTLGVGRGGQILLRGSESVEIVGNNSLRNPTAILSNLAPRATGNANSLSIETPNLQVSQSALISVETYSSGRGGDIMLRANQISLLGNPNANGDPTVISTRVSRGATGQGGNFAIYADHILAKDWLLAIADTSSPGNSGNLNIQVGQFQVLDGAQFGTGTFGAGNGGTFTVNASDSIEIRGFDTTAAGIRTSGLFASAEPGSTGNGSTLNITTGKLQVTNGGMLSSGTNGTGRAGDITIRAQEVEVADPVVTFVGAVSGLVATTNSRNTNGNGSNLKIYTDRLRVLRGGQIAAATQGATRAGNIEIHAREVDVSGASADGKFRSSIVASSTTTAKAGSIDLFSDRLSVRNSGNLTVSNTGSGDAGNLNVRTRDLLLDYGASLQAEVKGGNQGNIDLQVRDVLLLRHGSNIITSATGTATGGNITINAPIIVGLEDSNIIANAVQGRGGNIQITTQGIVGLQYRDRLTAASDITASSEFGINGTVQINNIGVDPNSGLIELPANVTDPSQQIATGCADSTGSSFIATGRGGIPQNPSQEVKSDRTWSDIRNISAYRSQQQVQDQIPQSPETLVQATGWHRNAQGKIELVADKSSNQVQLSLTCTAVPKS
jgi:filamentous hemagglutinin family protein